MPQLPMGRLIQLPGKRLPGKAEKVSAQQRARTARGIHGFTRAGTHGLKQKSGARIGVTPFEFGQPPLINRGKPIGSVGPIM